mgnify:CR=1 FL=1
MTMWEKIKFQYNCWKVRRQIRKTGPFWRKPCTPEPPIRLYFVETSDPETGKYEHKVVTTSKLDKERKIDTKDTHVSSDFREPSHVVVYPNPRFLD